MPKFQASITRSCYQVREEEVEADTIEQACSKAQDMAGGLDFSGLEKSADYEVEIHGPRNQTLKVKHQRTTADPKPTQDQTVNVIEIRDGYDITLKAFPDDQEGNKKAEAAFSAIIQKEYDATGVHTQAALDDGIYEQGNHKVLLVHST